MPLICPKCSAPGLEYVTSMELPPPGIFQEMQVQLVACPRCAFEAASVYLESRAFADRDLIRHWAYGLEREILTHIEQSIAACPDRRSKECVCPSHTSLVERYHLAGETGFFQGIPTSGRFDIEWVSGI